MTPQIHKVFIVQNRFHYSCDWFLLFFIKDLKIPEKFFIQWFPKMTSSVNRNVVHCGIILCAFRGIKLANVWGILFFFWKKGRNEFNWMVMDVSSNHELSRKRRAKSKLLFFSSYYFVKSRNKCKFEWRASWVFSIRQRRPGIFKEVSSNDF